ncbi:GntR family transcriptional regulator [Edaphobacillus lindanitolerans]|uniref:Transcriptional regulator, GntR family n=1 Tax=Edaphobacillus lindanitolerans TaxID=550447 RepID=A0A1U7PNS1_9BACI|nr:GntR family transcriptional regulator [Edaphobacillus lindanitolerans]SIT73983.1 transcriptional regulator, GntR family [Edaphobacillus lindanitolerans]
MKVIKPSETLAEQAYALLKRDIINGELKENQPLPEETISKELGISRTPLRDALSRLALEGLIIQKKGRPAIVAGFTREKSLEYMEIRSVLEIHSITKIMDRVDAEFIDALRENLAGQRSAIEKNNFQEFIELDREFHILLASKNSNEELKDMVERMNTGVNRAFLILSSTVPQSARSAYAEHVEIIEALEQKDAALAKEKTIIHLNNVEKRFLKYYSNISQ